MPFGTQVTDLNETSVAKEIPGGRGVVTVDHVAPSPCTTTAAVGADDAEDDWGALPTIRQELVEAQATALSESSANPLGPTTGTGVQVVSEPTTMSPLD
jgi:hypothetical protein